MLIFIPTCSVCYALLREDVYRKIDKKKKKAEAAVVLVEEKEAL